MQSILSRLALGFLIVLALGSTLVMATISIQRLISALYFNDAVWPNSLLVVIGGGTFLFAFVLCIWIMPKFIHFSSSE